MFETLPPLFFDLDFNLLLFLFSLVENVPLATRTPLLLDDLLKTSYSSLWNLNLFELLQ